MTVSLTSVTLFMATVSNSTTDAILIILVTLPVITFAILIKYLFMRLSSL